jgi:son of sevenless-like protein
VRCPEPFQPLFIQAENNLEGFFSELQREPDKGQLSIGGERYILTRAATFSVQLRQLLEKEYGRIAADKLTYALGRAAGINDAEFFIRKLGLERGPSALSAGPVHFAMVGWAFVDIFPESAPTPDENYFLEYEHPYSFEADSYIQRGVRSERPVCHMNAGYSSGWCQVSFGVELEAREITCRACGHDRCLFVMGHRSRVHEYVVAAQEKYGAR